MVGGISYQNKMNPNAADNYSKFVADAEAVLAAAGYTPNKMMWECYKGSHAEAITKTLTDSDGNTYAFTARMVNLGIYALLVSKNDAPIVIIYDFCDH